MPKFLITCPKGLEELLSQEAIDLGLSTKLTVGGVFAELPDGEFYSIYKFCIYSRFANRVIWLISEFQCLDNDMLFQQVYSTPWLQHFSVENTIAVDFRGTNKFINNTNYGAMLVKDAVVDHFVHRSDERPNVNTKDPDIRIFFQLGKNTATLGIDVSGGSLHKRGYRLQAAKAPLKENLAAALCARARNFSPEGQWLDPFCGSGTLLVEGVLADLGIASQVERQYFGFE
ncbi:MAG: 23S rRNA (guanine(2445)-N(2))/(guanine(2069)-N(7))-methyltransferase, partial [Sinobacterium sp.]|nr:23S rRNA (guanine(2445)-N(2))/(guanine(2069)-N(7))-methyltransferase [Sinobacterium sp.]